VKEKRDIKIRLTPAGTQIPSTIAPGDVRGNPCEPGGYTRKPSLMTALRYGSALAAVAVMSSYDSNDVSTSSWSFCRDVGFVQRWKTVAARKVATVSPPAMLVERC